MEAGARGAGAEAVGLVLAYVLMALAIAVDHGHYAPRALLLLAACAAALCWAARRFVADRAATDPDPDRWLAIALVVLLIAGTLDAPGYHLRSDGFRVVFVAIQCALAALVVAAFLSPWAGVRMQRGTLLVAVALGVGLRIAIVIASPAPEIDVFTQFQESAANLLRGLDPYSTPVSDPSGGRFGYHVTGYAYPPAGLYAQTAAFAAFGDIRYAYIAFEMVAMAALYAITAPVRRRAAALLVMLFLFHPRALFEIEQAWNEPLLVGAAAVFVWLAGARPASRWVPIAFGVLLSLKQYLVFLALLWFALARRWRTLPIVAAVVVATWLPFLVWDPSAAIDNGLLFQFRTPFRPDGLTLSAAVHQWLGWAPTKWVAITVGMVTATITGHLVRGRPLVSGWLYASVLTTLAMFLAGSQAFANYYYFLGALILLLIAMRLRDTAPPAVTT